MGEEINVKKSLQDLVSLLGEIYEEFSKNRGTYQNFDDLISGNIRTPTGFLVPLKIHRFVFENYDLMILQAYVKLSQYMLRAEEEVFILTTLRIQQELGIKKIDIFFSDVLSEDHRKKARLVSVLSDWTMISGYKYRKYYEKLFIEEKELLDSRGKKIFEDINNYVVDNSVEIPIALFKKMKQYQMRLFAEYTREIPTLSFIKDSSSFSFIFHISILPKNLLFDNFES
ncbi:MAG TPA: hypothetical protein ENI04_00290, partial [Candidatus Wildermuthbacteria bacterium]|nr:hypothetical protein [Candidatus Wildermuthbacteria bacterium]